MYIKESLKSLKILNEMKIESYILIKFSFQQFFKHVIIKNNISNI